MTTVYTVTISFRIKVDSIFGFWLTIILIVVISSRPSGGDETYAEKGHGASPNELACIIARCAFKIAVQDCRSKNDGERKEYELDRNDLGSIEALKCPIDVLNLHDSSADQNEE